MGDGKEGVGDQAQDSDGDDGSDDPVGPEVTLGDQDEAPDPMLGRHELGDNEVRPSPSHGDSERIDDFGKRRRKEDFEPGADRGMVFQSYSLYPWLSVRRNIEFGPEIKKVPAADRRKTSDELIHLMKLDGFADAYPKVLSGGMKQRAAIARALAGDPEVLLMDEPFGALDAQTRQIMQELLTDIWQRYRKTVLFVTHDIEEAIFLGDVIYVMTSRPGRIRTTLAVDIPRPRTFDTLTGPRFAELRNQVVGVIHEESLKAVESELARA